MMMNRFCKRLLAGLICMTLTMTLIPNPAFALEEAKASTEVVALREENVKHFDMGDGTYQAISYSHPVHEKDSNGNWQDIDFGMTRKQTRGVATYTNAASGTAFAATYTQNAPLVTLSGEGTSIAMTLAPSGTNKNASAFTTQSIATANANAQVSNPQSTIRTIEDAENAKFSSTIFYNDVMPNIDLEYIVDPGTVKENIIVKAPAEEYAYLFSMDLTGLYPELLDDGSIALYNETTKEMDYAIPAPFMYDGLGNMSEDVAYTLVKIQGTYYLKVIANADWINKEGRTFPITIDPTTTKYSFGLEDTYISSNNPDTVNGTNTRLWVRSNRTAYFLNIPVPTIPSFAELNWAALSAYYYYFDNINTGSVLIDAHRIGLGPWDENTLTWNSIKNVSNFALHPTTLSTNIASANVSSATINNPQRINFYITETVKGWTNNTYPNYGIALKYNTTSENQSVLLHSSESPGGYGPYLTYQYYNNALSKKHLRILYDSSCELPDGKILDYFYSAVQSFPNQFSVIFLCDSISLSLQLDGAVCTPALWGEICSEQCGPLSICASAHHQSATRLLSKDTSIYNYTYRIVGHKLCAYNDGEHQAVVGQGEVHGLNSISSTIESSNLARSIQHELSHNLGADHSYCISSQSCVLNGQMNFWCTACTQRIRGSN